MSDENKPGSQLEILLQQLAGEGLSSTQWQELNHLLLTSAAARREYLRFQYLNARLATLAWEPTTLAQSAVSGTALAAGDLSGTALAPGDLSGTALAAGDTPTRSVSEESTPHAPREAGHHAERDGYYRQSTFRISAIAAVLAFIAIGILAYSFWPSPAVLPVVHQAPAAKIANLTDAKWAGVSSRTGDTLLAGQQLLLQSGSAEITFNSQARVIVSGPVELTIVDAGACRLAIGKLTAQVPNPAKGFQVHTPSGTVTDLGTEFGVYVRNEAAGVRLEEIAEEEQQPVGGPQQDGAQPPVTEVHVFKGQVDVAPLSEEDSLLPNPKSEISNPKSQILSAGQAVTISDNKVQPLPAADPFKFALDKLQGKPRTVLLTEDFEAYEVGKKDKALGAWIIQTGTRKGQGVAIGDFRTTYAEAEAQHLITEPETIPPPATIAHLLSLVPSAPNPPDTFPRVAHPIDAPQLAGTCRVLVEFVFIPAHQVIEPSLAFAAEAGPAPGIEFWRNADAAASPLRWRPSHFYRIRLLLDVVDGRPREAHVERSVWREAKGWIRDTDYRTPVPNVDWTTPPKFVIFGYPTVTPQTPPGVLSIDNIRIEVISEK